MCSFWHRFARNCKVVRSCLVFCPWVRLDVDVLGFIFCLVGFKSRLSIDIAYWCTVPRHLIFQRGHYTAAATPRPPSLRLWSRADLGRLRNILVSSSKEGRLKRIRRLQTFFPVTILFTKIFLDCPENLLGWKLDVISALQFRFHFGDHIFPLINFAFDGCPR